jgi:putative salt-induced outer membrane protein YdiY
MSPPHLRTLSICLILLCWAGPAWSDEVSLKNGDRVTGEVVKMGDGSLTLKTTYGGEIKIDWKEIQGLTSAGPLALQLRDGSVLRGRVSSPAPNQIVVTGEPFGSTTAMSFADIQAITPPPPITYTGTFNFGGNITDGNTKTTALNASARFTARAERQRFGLEAKYNYGEVNSLISTRNSLLGLNYDYFVTKRVYTTVFTLLEQDTFQDLNLRSTAGAGLGYQFIDTKRTKLSGDLGLAYVNENFRTQPDTDSASGRWSVTFNHEFLPDVLFFFHRNEGYYDLKAPNGYRIRADQGLRFPVYKGFSLNLEYDVRYNSNPAAGRKTTDLAYIMGVSYAFSE